MNKIVDRDPKSALGYVEQPLDRAADKRGDASALAAMESQPGAKMYVVSGEHIILRKDGDECCAFFALDAARKLGDVTQSVFLGLRGKIAHFGYRLDPAAVESLKSRTDLHVTDLRTIAVNGLVPSEDLTPFAEAKAVLHWHGRHQYCANCGAATVSIQAGWRRDCAHCSAQHFPRTDPVVIMLVVSGDQCLLGRQPHFKPGMWSCLAGFVEPGESIEDAVRRETLEEAGIVCGAVRYFASQPWPFPSSLMIGCHAEALTHEIRIDRLELEDARWFGRDEAAAMLTQSHRDGLTAPPAVAIAYHILRGWATVS